MAFVFRRLAATCLVLALCLTGHQAAVARGGGVVAGEAVICIGHAVVTVQLDANGQPVDAVHLCPDAALALFVAEAWEYQFAHLPVGRDLAPGWRLGDVSLPGLRVAAAKARGPPVPV